MGGDGVVAGEAPRGPIHSLAFLPAAPGKTLCASLAGIPFPVNYTLI